MNKRILISLSVIGAVAAIATGGTIAYFSDTETSTGNTFTAGTIDISVNNMNPWNQSFTLADMKPSYTDYINFTIQNFGSDPNPVNVWKKLVVVSELTGAVSEPECTEEGGIWVNNACGFDGNHLWAPNDNLSSAIWYDLYVEVLNASGAKIWWQTIYPDGVKTIDDVYYNSTSGQYDREVYLGMIPAGYSMKVTQSYHMKGDTTNWAQGDQMTFSINLRAVQIQGIAVLENKTGDPDWQILGGDTIQGTLTYKVKNPTFDFTFIGKAPLPSHSYVLAAGWTANGAGFDVDTQLGTGVTDASGAITIIGNPELSKDMKDVKVWLVPAENWSSSVMNWTGWPSMVPNILWETGLIWYDDTNN